jgi:hypothetical protein
MNLLKKSLKVEPKGMAASFGHLLFRVSVGLLIFYIHGLHKLEGWIAYLQHGTPWTLAEEMAGIHMPLETHQQSAACHDHGCHDALQPLFTATETTRNRYAEFFGLRCDCFAF